MSRITIRNLDDDVKRRLLARAAEHGRSMEEEARETLCQVVTWPRALRDLGQSIQRGLPKSEASIFPSPSAAR
ncbi:FitA-like ribbon-helix-helix domain-containing protein [Stagnihabitans tardus]|uniref:FitA-like ribbon-helix-helix domain-containing protein n=1 Tax=Stagnihabitans tardus TaxID=2699202 RepID=UPI001D1244AF|nr:hypothetical protein [Stagnihabitans tardus]